jgi:hypothetical protein
MRHGANIVSIQYSWQDNCLFQPSFNVGLEATSFEKSILQFHDLRGDHLPDLQDTNGIEREETVAGGRTGVKTKDAFFHPVARPVGMPEDETVHTPEFLFHRLVHPWEHSAGMDQSQTETIYIEHHLVGEETPDLGRIGIAIDCPYLFLVENIQNGKIGQITGM